MLLMLMLHRIHNFLVIVQYLSFTCVRDVHENSKGEIDLTENRIDLSPDESWLDPETLPSY